MSSRFLVGLGAWLLGTATATTGSMIAVNELAQHLLDPPTLELSAQAKSTDYDPGTSTKAPSQAASATPPAHTNKRITKAKPSAQSSLSPAASSPDPSSAAGTLLVSADGSVMATCGAGGAYLLYWIPDTGFQADDVYRGPAATASVLFRGSQDGVVMKVTCSGGTPVAHVYPATDGDDGPGGDPSGSPSATPSGTHSDE